MDKKNGERNLKYNRNEKRVNDTYAKHNNNVGVGSTYDPKEDATQYGEFISSFHNWLPTEKQKEKAKHIEKISKK